MQPVPPVPADIPWPRRGVLRPSPIWGERPPFVYDLFVGEEVVSRAALVISASARNYASDLVPDFEVTAPSVEQALRALDLEAEARALRLAPWLRDAETRCTWLSHRLSRELLWRRELSRELWWRKREMTGDGSLILERLEQWRYQDPSRRTYRAAQFADFALVQLSVGGQELEVWQDHVLDRAIDAALAEAAHAEQSHTQHDAPIA